ncbi:MAG TPA: hypothetical protein VHR15_02200 [Ktedonobacterales bacterium]|jgi:uncharacterized integral membrane protein|nr:hypothetical protein [Ktedonobacterales bacterium]
MMRLARFLIAYGVVSVLGVVVSLFLAQNTQVERLTFFGRDVSTSLAWIMLAATAAGFLFALLLLLPGRIAATLHIWSLRKETRQLDEELVWQSERHDELLDHHERLLSGHEWLLGVYRRTRGDLDQAISERDALKIHLAKANEALATQKKVVVQREIIIPAPVRQTSESTPTAPRIQAVPKVPAKVPAAVALDEPEDVQEKEPALSVSAQALESATSEPVASIQQEQVIATSDETASDESWLVHSSEPSRAIFGNALASRMRRVTSGLDSWQREVWSSAQRLYTQGAERVDQAIVRTRQFRATTWTDLRERLGGAGAGTEDRRRVSPLTHPK